MAPSHDRNNEWSAPVPCLSKAKPSRRPDHACIGKFSMRRDWRGRSGGARAVSMDKRPQRAGDGGIHERGQQPAKD